jgi:alanyl-tRNA synthetase
MLERVATLIKDNKQLAKQLKSAAKQTGSDILGQARQLLEKCEKVNGTSIIISKLEDASADQCREAIDMLKKKTDSVAIVFGFAEDDKVTLLAAVSDDLIKKGLKAGDIVKNIAPIVGGGGGGRVGSFSGNPSGDANNFFPTQIGAIPQNVPDVNATPIKAYVVASDIADSTRAQEILKQKSTL